MKCVTLFILHASAYTHLVIFVTCVCTLYGEKLLYCTHVFLLFNQRKYSDLKCACVCVCGFCFLSLIQSCCIVRMYFFLISISIPKVHTMCGVESGSFVYKSVYPE